MSIIIKIKEIGKTQGHTFASLERELGFSSGSIRKWDTNSPSADKLVKVAKYLNTSVDYLLGISNEKNLRSENAGEKHLINLYNELNAEGKEKLIDYADDLIESAKYKKDSEISVSAV